MKHIRLQSDDIPTAPFLMDRRRNPDRRALWRGGRRDTDWHNRPLGAWARVRGPIGEPRWKVVWGALHLW